MGTELIDMGGVLELYPINGKTTDVETLAKKQHLWEVRLTSKLLKCGLDFEVREYLLTGM